MAAKQTPRDALVIQAILKDMGITEYEPRVVNQLMEFVYRYVTNVLDDAKAYANHAKKKAIDLEDVKLAVTMQIDQSFTSPPDRELLMELARSKNVIPLPSVKPHCGIRLPADCYCMTACNYRLKSLKKGNKSGLGAGGSGASASRMSTLGGVKAVLRPNSPIVRVTSANTTATSTTPRAVVKVSTPATTTTPKIQITIPQQPAAPPADKPESDSTRGIKREREDDEDYDA